MNHCFSPSFSTPGNKQGWKSLCLIPLACIFLLACTNDNEEDLFGTEDCGPEAVSLQNDVQPIISTNCAVTNCHVAGSQPPNYKEQDNIIDFAASIKVRTRNRTMPPPTSGITLSEEEIQLISCWVDSGAPNN